MRKLLLVLFCACSSLANAQVWYTFEDDSYKSTLTIDALNFQGNVWQVGKPYKNVFNKAYLMTNAIVTDTVNPYPAINTSVFYIKVPTHADSLLHRFVSSLDFWYRLDIDADASAKVEISGNKGITWRDLLKDASGVFNCGYAQTKASLDSSTYGWASFYINFSALRDSLTADTTIFKFTFSSTKNDQHKAGWMIDEMSVQYSSEVAVQQLSAPASIHIYPDPAGDQLTISATERIHNITICNSMGQMVYTHEYNAQEVPVSTRGFAPGTYFLKVNNNATKKFIKR